MNFQEILKTVLLGIIEGVTEWLPVSSTGHLLLFDAFFPLDQSAAFKEFFLVVLQLAAVLAVALLFFKKLCPVEKKANGLAVKKNALSLWGKTFLACLPAGIIGILCDDFLEAKLHTPLVIALMLIVYGVAFLAVESRKNRGFRIETVENIDAKTALFIGLFQVLSLIPGTSRSGVTVLGGILLGVSRPAAAEFSFFLALPVMFGASFIKLLKFLSLGAGFSAAEILLLTVGCLVAFFVSLAAVKFLMNFVKKHDFKIFGIYRIALGFLILSALVLPFIG